MARTIQIYDTTLRDGCQAEDISLTLEDKLRITERLDDFGIAYVEGGWPGSNPRDEAYFTEVKRLTLTQIKVAAFGSTRRAGVRASDDKNLEKLVRAETPVVTIFGKSWDLHVHRALNIFLGRTRRKIQLCVECIKLEKIAVRLTRWRTRSSVAGLSEIVLTLTRSVGEFFVLWNSLRQRTQFGRQIEGNPVHPGSHRGVGVVGNQSETPGARRRGGPLQGGRKVRTFTRELSRNRSARCEIRALHFQGQRHTPSGGNEGFAAARNTQRHEE